MDKPRYADATWSLLVTDMETGESFYELNADQMSLTGSTRKLFSVGAALDELGADHRQVTPVHRQGTVAADGTLDGNLILVGGGQPYGAREIGKSLGVPVVAEIADDVDTARHLSDGAPRSRRFDTSKLARSLHTAAAQLGARFERSSELVRG
jgi:hypothetical protein